MHSFNSDQLGPIGKLFALQLESHDPVIRQVRLRFDVGPHWCNGAGHVQGGALCAMLDLSFTSAALCASDFKLGMPTLEMKTCFLAAGRTGQLWGVGTVVKPGRRCYFLEGRILDAGGKVIATATATALPSPLQ